MNSFLDKALIRKANTLSITLCSHQENQNRNIIDTKMDEEYCSKLHANILTSKNSSTIRNIMFKNTIYKFNNITYNYTKNDCYKDLFIEHNLFKLNDTLDLYCQYSNRKQIDPFYFPCKQSYHIDTIEEGALLQLTDTISIYMFNNYKIKIIVKIDEYIDNTLETLKQVISTLNTQNTI